MGGNVGRRQTLQVELQAARENRYRDLLRIGGRQQELHVRRRLFQRLEQRVEAGGREHVHLVDQVHLVTPPGRRKLHVVHEVARLLHLGPRRRVHLDEVDEAALVDLLAGPALAARRGGRAMVAVEALRQHPGQGGLADATGPGEQECVVHSAPVERVAQGTHDMLLPHQLVEVSWAPLTRQDLVAHVVVRLVAMITPGIRCTPSPAPPPARPRPPGEESREGAGERSGEGPCQGPCEGPRAGSGASIRPGQRAGRTGSTPTNAADPRRGWRHGAAAARRPRYPTPEPPVKPPMASPLGRPRLRADPTRASRRAAPGKPDRRNARGERLAHGRVRRRPRRGRPAAHLRPVRS